MKPNSTFTALVTSDASLIRCELARVRPFVSLAGAYAALGAWSDGMVLQRRYGGEGQRAEVWECPDSDVVVIAAGALDGQPDEAAQPFRFHQWLFTQTGRVGRAAHVRDRLFEQLPEFLQNMVRGKTLEEVAFAHFLAGLRALGRTDDVSLEAAVVAKVLQGVAREVEAAAAEAGATEKPGLALLASNGRVLAAARRGAAELNWALLEGQVACARCDIAANASEGEALVRDHRRRRSVIISTGALGAGQVALAEGTALAVDKSLAVKVLPPL